MWHGRTDQNKRILFPVSTDNNDSSLRQANDFDEQYGVSLQPSTLVMNDDWIEGYNLKTTPMLESNNFGQQTQLQRQLLNQLTSPPTSGNNTNMTTNLVPGDYAVVLVTEAKGHTLRGQLLWKTTIQKFDTFQSNNHLTQLSRDIQCSIGTTTTDAMNL